MGRIIREGKINENIHTMPDELLGARVVGWVNSEGEQHFKKSAWWVMAITHNGVVKTTVSDDEFEPTTLQKDFARKICKYVNQNCAHGGAWLVGYFGEMFYMVWKDRDGDIQLPIEFPHPPHVLMGWSNETFAEHCEQALTRWVEWHEAMDYSRSQTKKVAQGQKLDS